MISLVLALLILWIALATASASRWNSWGWSKAWLILFAYAGLCRICLWLFPVQTPLFSRLILGIFFFASLLRFNVNNFRISSFNQALWVASGLFIFFRNMHPQYDVDSISYHLPSIVWLHHKPYLNAVQQIIENQNFTYRLIGFEEFLSIPGLGLDFPYFAGLVGGILKLLSFYTLISLLPAPNRLGRWLAAFFLLIDDHFFFSGQSRFVYLTPSLIGLVAASYDFGFRSLRGSIPCAFYALIVAACLPACKFHGLYLAFGVLMILLCAVALHGQQFVGGSRVLLGKGLWKWMMSPIIILFSVYGLNFIETGSPTYPLPFGPFLPKYFHHSISLVSQGVPPGSFIKALFDPIRTLVFSGNLALKIAAVLIGPMTLLAIFIQIKSIRNRIGQWLHMVKLRISKRHIEFAAFGFIVSLLWASVSEAIVHAESRYPRYAMGVSILAISASLRAVRFEKIARVRKILERMRSVIAVIGCALLVITIDTRYFNIPTNQRTNWRDLFITFRNSNYRNLDFSSSDVRQLLDADWVRNISGIDRCVESLGKQRPDLNFKLKSGKGVLLFAPGLGWPSFYSMPYAIRGDLFGSLRLPGSVSSLRDAGIEYVLFPSRWRHAIPDEMSNLNFSYSILKEAIAKPARCSDGDMEFVQF